MRFIIIYEYSIIFVNFITHKHVAPDVERNKINSRMSRNLHPVHIIVVATFTV